MYKSLYCFSVYFNVEPCALGEETVLSAYSKYQINLICFLLSLTLESLVSDSKIPCL